MLTKLSLESARELAEILEQKGKQLAPEEDTPLAEAVEASEDSFKSETSSIVDEETALESLMEATMSPSEEPGYTHDAIIAQQAEQIAGVMNRRLGLVKNIFAPMVESLSQKLLTELSSTLPITPVIKPTGVSILLGYPTFSRFFEGYRDLNTNDVVPGINVGLSSEAFSQKYLESKKTGIPEVDMILTEVEACLVDEGVDILSYLKSIYLNGQSVGQLNYTKQEEVYTMVLAFFLGKYLLDDSENRENLVLSLESYREGLVAIIAKLANDTLRGINYYQNQVETGVLIIEEALYKDTPTIYVNEGVYKTYLEQGGLDGAIYGAAIQHQRPTLTELLSQQQDYIQAQDEHMQQHVDELRMNAGKDLQGLALRHVFTLIDGIPMDVLQTLPSLTEYLHDQVELKSHLKNLAADFIQSTQPPAPADIQNYLMSLVSVMVGELGFGKLIYLLNKYKAGQEGYEQLTTKQAAYYVAVDEIAVYLTQQTQPN